MQILAKVDAHAGILVESSSNAWVVVSTLNTTAIKQSEIEKSYLCSGQSFSKKPKSLKTSPLEELETILLEWFRQASTVIASIDGPT
jgi:hypothetical protein